MNEWMSRWIRREEERDGGDMKERERESNAVAEKKVSLECLRTVPFTDFRYLLRIATCTLMIL